MGLQLAFVGSWRSWSRVRCLCLIIFCILISSVLMAVQLNGDALRYAAKDLKANREVVLAAVQQNGLALEHASRAAAVARAWRSRPRRGAGGRGVEEEDSG